MTPKHSARIDVDRFHPQMLAPKNWPLWLVLVPWRSTAYLPFRLQMWIGKALGRCILALAGKRQNITDTNLRLCFPEWDDIERANVLTRNFESVGIAIIETAMAWWGTEKRIKKIGRVEGLEYLESAQRNGRGVILLGAHFTNFEMFVRILSQYADISGMYRRHDNDAYEWVVRRSRGKWLKNHITRKKVRLMLEQVKKGDAVVLGIDQDLGPDHAAFVPFFGIPTATITSISSYARSTGAAIVPVAYYREDPKASYVVKISPAIKGFPSGDDFEDTKRLSLIIEHAVRAQPDQYLWQHKRFKTRPPGQPTYYE